MRLTKVQRKLKNLNVEYSYREVQETGELFFKDKDGNRYSVMEFTGITGNTVIGIMTSGIDFNFDTYNQWRIVKWLEEHEERFAE